MKMYQVWTSGFCSSDTEGRTTAPKYKGVAYSESFEEAKKTIYQEAINAYKGAENKPYWNVSEDGSVNAYYMCGLYESFDEALEDCRKMAHIPDGVASGGYIREPKKIYKPEEK